MRRYQLVALHIGPTGKRKTDVLRNATTLDALWAWIRRRQSQPKRPLRRLAWIQVAGHDALQTLGPGGPNRRRLTGPAHV